MRGTAEPAVARYFYFKNDEGGWAHICEIQLVHVHLYSVRKNMGAHRNYNNFRAALELCEKVGADPEEGSDETVLVLEALVWRKKSARLFRCSCSHDADQLQWSCP